MFNPFDRRAKVAPSQYPRLPFHGLRLFQLTASLVVGAIMLYFIWHLTHDSWATPWTFIWLTSASLFSIAALLFTMILHCVAGLNPRVNIFINGFLLVLWTLSWSLLTWYMSGTLTHVCDIEHWSEDVGIMVCRLYKTLFSFTLLGFLATLAAFILDLYVHRQVSRRGIYRLHDMDSKRVSAPRPEATRGPFTDDAHLDDVEPRVSEAWEPPRASIGPYAERSQPLHSGDADEKEESKMRAMQGYSVPEHQFAYDTEYRGHGGAVAVEEGEKEKLYDGPQEQ